MRFKIDVEVFGKFPDLVVALPIVFGFDNNIKQAESLAFLRKQELDLREKLNLETFWKDGRVTTYMEVFNKFGVDPNKFLPAHVALAKRVLEGGNLPDINPIVNLYNAMSLKYLTPFGGEDLDTLYGDFRLIVAEGGEKWFPIGGGKAKLAQKGELVWTDELDLSTRALNWRQCDRTKMTNQSKSGYFVMDGFQDINRENIEIAAGEFVEMMTQMFGGSGKIYWLDKENPEIEIDFESKKITSEVKEKIKVLSKSKVFQNKNETKSQPTGEVAKIIYESIERTATHLIGPDEKMPIFTVEHPADESHGDFSSNIAMQIFGSVKASPVGRLHNVYGKFGSNPRECALIITKELRKSEVLGEFVDLEAINVAGPGFINFHLKKEAIAGIINNILCDKWKKPLMGRKISVEYTDPNPFKEFHLGHLYSNLIGESMARIYEESGATVWRADFYGDVGMHVAKSIWGIRKKMKDDNVGLEDLRKMPFKDRQHFLGQGYALGVNSYAEKEEVQDEVKKLNQLIFVAGQEYQKKRNSRQPMIDYRKYIEGREDELSEIQPLYEAGLDWSLEYFESYYKRLGTKFDGYYPESWVGELGVKEVEKGLEMNILERSQEAVIFPGEKYGLHTRVFLNKFGLPTYEAKDLGLVLAKYQDFQFDLSLNVFGREIDEYYDVVHKAMTLIEPELGAKQFHLAHGMVKLPTGKMSSRTGNVITVEWLLDESINRARMLINNDSLSKGDKDLVANKVGLAAVKYALLKHGIGGDVIFDFDQSVSFDGASGPYLQYTYARTRGVLSKVQDKIPDLSFPESEISSEELSVLRWLMKYGEVVSKAGEQKAPNVIAEYLFDLSQKFNVFYNKYQILGKSVVGGRVVANIGDTKMIFFRLGMTRAVGQVLKRGLNLLGIGVVEAM